MDSLQDDSSSSPGVMAMAWPTPLRSTQIWSLYVRKLEPILVEPFATRSFRMLPVQCFNPKIDGFSVAWSRRLVYVHSHFRGEMVAFYDNIQAIHDKVVWIYIPVDRDEYLADVWTRRGRYHSSAGLLVSAS